ncbi:hypothetical protein LINGRAHAP2_LOCUS29545, partial [Linum grandiflorum]
RYPAAFNFGDSNSATGGSVTSVTFSSVLPTVKPTSTSLPAVSATAALLLISSLLVSKIHIHFLFSPR